MTNDNHKHKWHVPDESKGQGTIDDNIRKYQPLGMPGPIKFEYTMYCDCGAKIIMDDENEKLDRIIEPKNTYKGEER